MGRVVRDDPKKPLHSPAPFPEQSAGPQSSKLCYFSSDVPRRHHEAVTKEQRPTAGPGLSFRGQQTPQDAVHLRAPGSAPLRGAPPTSHTTPSRRPPPAHLPRPGGRRAPRRPKRSLRPPLIQSLALAAASRAAISASCHRGDWAAPSGRAASPGPANQRRPGRPAHAARGCRSGAGRGGLTWPPCGAEAWGWPGSPRPPPSPGVLAGFLSR